MQTQEEAVRRDMFKQHKEFQKLTEELEEHKKEKLNYIKELQNLGAKLNEIRNCTLNNFNHSNDQLVSLTEEKEVNSQNNDEELDNEEALVLLNEENKEFIIKRLLLEKKKYKEIILAMKTEENEINNYILEIESELEGMNKFKDYSMSKISNLESLIEKYKIQINNIFEKSLTLELQIEHNL